VNLTLVEQPATEEVLRAYVEVTIAFTATSRLRVDPIDNGLGGVRLVEEPLTSPEFHDGDAIEGEGPLSWLDRWDISRWVAISAFDGEQRVGGAVVGGHTGDVWFLRGREDMSALWDIRIDPGYRRQGVGRALLERAAEWSRRQGFRWLKIETQNTNVAACRFYESMGARLGAFDRFAYANIPEETELDWFLEL
jgi:ribosomal protein S18 acetylase RimI-like enzyme